MGSPNWNYSDIEEFESTLDSLITDLQKLKNYISERDVVDEIDKGYLGQSKQWINENYKLLLACFSGVLAWRSDGLVIAGKTDSERDEHKVIVDAKISKVLEQEYERKAG